VKRVKNREPWRGLYRYMYLVAPSRAAAPTRPTLAPVFAKYDMTPLGPPLKAD